MIPGTGLYPDVEEGVYHADTDLAPTLGRSLSASGAKTILDCAARFRHERDHGRPSKPAYDFGHVAHELILGKGAGIVVVDAADWRTKAAKDARDAAYVDGKAPVLQEDYERAEAVSIAVRSHPIAGAIFGEGQPEVSAYCIDEATGVTMRARFDWLHPKAIVDLKTAAAGGANPTRIARTAVDFGYALQAAWYRRVHHAVTGEWLPFVHVFVEKDLPHLVTVAQFSDAALAYGDEKADAALALYAQCESTNVWPAYGDDIIPIDLPRWAS